MILITGATGLVGGHLVWFLLKENKEKIVAIRRENSSLDSLKKIFSYYTDEIEYYLSKIEWRTGDILDKESIRIAMEDISQVYHCAGMVSIGNDTNALTDTNITGTKNMVEISLEKQIEKFCFVSSIAACGSSQTGKEIDENDKWVDSPERSLYSRSKYYAEQEVWEGIKQGLKAVIVNPGVILGVSGTNTGSSQLFTQVKKGLPFYTNGGSAYVDVRDTALAMIKLMESNIQNERFILTAGNYSNKEILCWISDGFNKKRPFIPIGKNLFMLVGSLLEFLGKIFGFKPLINKGMARTASNRKYYTANKIKSYLNYDFIPIENCIMDVCRFLKKSAINLK